LEFLADRPMSELFDFILDGHLLLRPTRAAIALLGDDHVSFANVKLRSQDDAESTDLTISRRAARSGRRSKVVSYFDTEQNDKFARAQSIIAQRIRSAVCAPLLVSNAVLGVLYIDFTSARGVVAEDDVRLLAQIARFAAVTLERTRLREEAFAKARSMKSCARPTPFSAGCCPMCCRRSRGTRFAGANRPCKTVSGDYYDVVVRPDADLLRHRRRERKGHHRRAGDVERGYAFAIFTRTDPTPADLLRDINATLAPKTAPSKFVTMWAAACSIRRRRHRFRQRRPRLAAGSVEERRRSDELNRYRRQAFCRARGIAIRR